jgi:CRISPR system Cascade subunit CasA
MPGEQTLKQNKDLFLKRGTVRHLCLPCAAMALYCVQANTGGFGKGHRTSLRGGGPLTSIVSGETLWETIWFNVLEDRVFNPEHVPGAPDFLKVFPWLSPTRTSEKGEMTTPGDVHPSHMFFGMPLRVRLDVENSKEPCDICGEVHDTSVSRFLIRSYGTNYSGNWNHPLTPYIFSQKTKETRSKKMSAGGIIYRHWLGLMQRAPGGTNDLVLDPARSVTAFKEKKSLIEEYLPVEKTRIWSFGYEVDSGKARAWYEGTMPMVMVPPDDRPVFEATIEQVVMSAESAASSLRYSTTHALYKEPKNVRGDFSFIDEDFWHTSERPFYELLGRIAPVVEEGLESATLADLKKEWVKNLYGVCLGLFDRYADSDLVGDRDPRRVVLNRRSLEFRVSTRNPDLCKLLHLPVPEGSAVKKTRKKSKQDDK